MNAVVVYLFSILVKLYTAVCVNSVYALVKFAQLIQLCLLSLLYKCYWWGRHWLSTSLAQA